MKWTEERVLEVVNECRIAGTQAANKKHRELEASGPQYAVVSGGRQVGCLLDVCGFAHVHISARTGFYRIAKKLSDNRRLRFYCDKEYYGGGHFSVYDTTRRQELSVNEASARAIATVLQSHGLEATMRSRID